MFILHQVDTWLFVVLNSFAGRWAWLDSLTRLLLNDYFVPTMMAVVLILLWFDGDGHPRRLTNQRAVLVGTLSAALVNILLKIMNLLYFRPRPFETISTRLLFYQPTDSSLPSNAAALGFSIAAGVWIYQRRWGWVLLAIAAIFGFSRIIGGIHYPFDVLTGAAAGWLSAWIIHTQRKMVDWVLLVIIAITQKVGLP